MHLLSILIEYNQRISCMVINIVEKFPIEGIPVLWGFMEKRTSSWIYNEQNQIADYQANINA